VVVTVTVLGFVVVAAVAGREPEPHPARPSAASTQVTPDAIEPVNLAPRDIALTLSYSRRAARVSVGV
jgi:hypothetical protein